MNPEAIKKKRKKLNKTIERSLLAVAIGMKVYLSWPAPLNPDWLYALSDEDLDFNIKKYQEQRGRSAGVKLKLLVKEKNRRAACDWQRRIRK